MQRGRSAISLHDLVRADLVRLGDELRFRGDSDRRAVVTTDGRIEFGGRLREPIDGSEGRQQGNLNQRVAGLASHPRGPIPDSVRTARFVAEGKPLTLSKG